jgi:predicted transcriptional regulator
VHDAIVARRRIAYTTVMTVMGRLAEAGLLTQERSGRAYRYAAASSREALTAATMREQLQGMAEEDRRAAMLHFLDDATADEIADLKLALAQVEARHSGGGPGARR